MPNWKKLIVSGSSAELTTLKLTGLSAGTPTTALMLDGSGNVEKRTLGSNAFNSTSYLTSINNSNWSGTDLSVANGGTGRSTLSSGQVLLGNGTSGINSRAIGIADNNIVEIDDADAADNDYARFTANGLEGRSASQVKSDLSLNNVENTALSTYTGNGGALDNQYITNGAGYITDGNTNWNNTYGFITNTVTSLTSLTSIGTLTSLTVDDITINSSTISDSGDLTLDVGGDISIDADGGDIILKDGGTIVGTFSMNQNSGDFDIRSRVSNKDLVFKGNDGGSEITALKFDMSDAGKAHFYGDVVISGSGADKLRVEGSGSTIFEVQGSQGQLFSVTDDLTGTIFNVSDISGVPILSVEGDGTVDVDGDLQATALGVGTAAPSTTGAIRATNDITAFYSSDKRLKNNITNIEDPLDKLKKINGVSFEWIPKEGIHDHIGKDYGVIAQEIEEVLPELVTTRDNGYKAVKYEKIVALLIETNKQLLSRIEELENKVK